jgi:hypothetical protein
LVLVGSGLAYVIAIASTAMRLLHRRQRQQLWWDDGWAALALAALLLMISFDLVKWSRDFGELFQHLRAKMRISH